MARPQTMTELKAPKNGKQGTYRIMDSGKYRWFKAWNKDHAMIQFRAGKEQRSKEQEKQDFLEEGRNLLAYGNGFLAYWEAIAGFDFPPEQNWNELVRYLEGHWGISTDEFAQKVLTDLEQNKPEPESKPKTRTIRQAIDVFLSRQASDVQAGNLSAGHYDTLARHLNYFADFYGSSKAVNSIDAMCLIEYSTHILTKTIGDNGWTKTYASTYMKVLRAWIKWAWSCDLLKDLPRNIDRKEIKLTAESTEVKVWEPSKIKTVLDFIPQRSEKLKLYCLLMLNTGVTQKDISDLEPSQVDWENRTITRKRSKTHDCVNVPTVTYPLWDSTFALLAKYGKRTGERVLTNGNGSPLKVESLKNGKLYKVDTVGTMYVRFRKRCHKANILTDSPTLKMFRKTSHSLIGNSSFASYKVYFLGHAPMTIADKHYFKLDQAEFAKAIKWLGETLGCSQP